MKEFFAGQFDIAVIGAGHAGIEAALAAARMGLETVCLTMNLDAVGNMPCNPAIGGTRKAFSPYRSEFLTQQPPFQSETARKRVFIHNFHPHCTAPFRVCLLLIESLRIIRKQKSRRFI